MKVDLNPIHKIGGSVSSLDPRPNLYPSHMCPLTIVRYSYNPTPAMTCPLMLNRPFAEPKGGLFVSGL